jgi:predicted nuclease of restriction endonuclease-like (RecB) superfamily
MEKVEINISECYEWIDKIKAKIHSTRTKIVLSANSRLLNLYWEIGKKIVKKQNKSDWESKIIEKMSVNLKHEFPEIKGFSKRNIYVMRQWYLLYSQKSEILPQVVAQIPWGQNRLIISKTKNVNEVFLCTRNT